MVVETKKRILITEELKESPVGLFLTAFGLELDTVFQKEYKNDYCFIVNDYCPDITTLPRLKLNPETTYEDAIECQMRALITQEHMEDPSVQLLIKSFMTNNHFELIESFSQDFKMITSLKIHEYLNVGYFTDTIIIEAYKSGFDNDLIRKYLNQLFEYTFKKIKSKLGGPILDVMYSFSDNVFAIEVSFQYPEFHLEEDFNHKDELLKDLVNHTNYFHTNYFTKRTRLTISSAWFKNISLKNFRSYSLTETRKKDTASGFEVPIVLGIEKKEKVFYYPRLPNGEIDQSWRLSLSRKLANFIKNHRESEETPKELENLTIKDIDEYLTGYPRQESLLAVDDEVKNFVLKSVKENLFDGVSDYVQSIANTDLDPQVDKITRLLSGKSLADMDEIIRVSGVTAKLNDETSVVKDWGSDEGIEEVRVAGVTDKIKTEEEWELLRGGLVEKIQEEVIRIKSQNGNIIKDDIIRVVSTELDLPIDTATILVKEILEEVIADDLNQKNSLDEAFNSKYSGVLSKQVNSRAREEELEIYIVRMKKVIEQMKEEIAKLRSLKTPKESKKSSAIDIGEPLDEQTEQEKQVEINGISELKRALSTTLGIMKNKEKIFSKQKLDFEQILESKETQNKELEARLEQLKDEFYRSREFANEEKLEQLQIENKNLNTRLEHINKQNAILNENMTKKESDSLIKKDNELEAFKNKLQLAQVLIDKFKQERTVLEGKGKNGKFRNENDNETSKEKAEKELILANLQTEKKVFEEKCRAQSMEIKVIEHKLKFALAQLDDAQKRKAQPVNKGSEAHTRQLENATARIIDANNEIAEKKKEVIKLKQENILLASKLAEFEKKVTGSDKKAA